MSQNFTFPQVSVLRGGIKYPRPGTPEWEEAQRIRAKYDQAVIDWEDRKGGQATGVTVWLAEKEDEYGDGSDLLLEVCWSLERAQAVCQHSSEKPNYSTADPDLTPLEWVSNDEFEWSASKGRGYYRVTAQKVMA